MALSALGLRHQLEEEVDGREGLLYAMFKSKNIAMTAAPLNAMALGGIMFIMVGVDGE